MDDAAEALLEAELLRLLNNYTIASLAGDAAGNALEVISVLARVDPRAARAWWSLHRYLRRVSSRAKVQVLYANGCRDLLPRPAAGP